MKYPELSREGCAIIQKYRSDLLRWNRQINLVSRKDTGQRLDMLLRQCQSGFEGAWQLLEEAGSGAPVWYFDLGSGGGLPGVVWHMLLSERVSRLDSWMVEPREKRAWFLARQGRHFASGKYSVLCRRWGDVAGSDVDLGPGAARVLVSLKALRMTDDQVLSGLASFAGVGIRGCSVLVARYYPKDQAYNEALIEKLNLQRENSIEPGTKIQFQPCGGSVVSLEEKKGVEASIVFSSYKAL